MPDPGKLIDADALKRYLEIAGGFDPIGSYESGCLAGYKYVLQQIEAQPDASEPLRARIAELEGKVDLLEGETDRLLNGCIQTAVKVLNRRADMVDAEVKLSTAAAVVQKRIIIPLIESALEEQRIENFYGFRFEFEGSKHQLYVTIGKGTGKSVEERWCEVTDENKRLKDEIALLKGAQDA